MKAIEEKIEACFDALRKSLKQYCTNHLNDIAQITKMNYNVIKKQEVL